MLIAGSLRMDVSQRGMPTFAWAVYTEIESSQRVARLRASREDNVRPFIILSIFFAALTLLAIAPEYAFALANPASVFCVQSGGKSEIRNGPRGQYGVCILPDGRVVEEWAYFRKMKGRVGKTQN
jgi:putative hemolysin